MIETISQIEDLYRYNDWANAKVFTMCEGLTNAQLDEPREIGFGSLRNTMFHILTAEQIWLERWQVAPWRSFPTDSLGLHIDDIQAQLRQISQARFQMLSSEKSSRWQRIINYKDSKGHEYSNPLDVLLLHVANHSTYHRAQALAFLKSFGRTTPIGLDYLLYKLARPTLEQDAESITKFRAIGLEVAKAPGWNASWDPLLMQRYVNYGQWATNQLLELLGDADDQVLDRDFNMGPGTIRKTLNHMLKVEAYWVGVMNGQPNTNPSNDGLSIAELSTQFGTIYSDLLKCVTTTDDTAAARLVTAAPGGIPLKLRVSEALVQLCCHGTHHRAQLVNMLRHAGRPVPSSDLITWWRQTNS